MLEEKALEFSAELTTTIRGVLAADCPLFVAERSPIAREVQRISVHTADGAPVPLVIRNEHCLSLIAEFECKWDHRATYLAVHKASFRVEPSRRGAPLFRYEFVADMQPLLPSAHLHIHAHRDEFVFALFRGGRGRPADRAKAVDKLSKRAEPQLSDVHFPLGGPRMRPCLEDILQMLHEEFDVDVKSGFQQVLNEGRARWRRRQVGAAVRDAPEIAARVLAEIGYTVLPPSDGPAPDRLDKLSQM